MITFFFVLVLIIAGSVYFFEPIEKKDKVSQELQKQVEDILKEIKNGRK